MSYDPHNWYWRADDGRIFSGATEAIVADTDPNFVAWSENYAPTVWPRDDAGNQTDVSLQQVLEPHGMFANLSYYAAFKRWQKEQSGLTLSYGWPIKTDDRSQGKINGLRLAALNQQNQSTTFHAADGSRHTVGDAEALVISNELQLHYDNCFNISADVLNKIADGSITTRDQIDQAFA